MLWDLDLERVRANVRQASTEDLLDRATIYRAGMEPEALDIIDRELRQRGIAGEEIARHEQARRERAILGPDGSPVLCRKCHRPAVVRAWSWGRLWGVVPLFPRRLAFCDEHRPRS